MVREMKHTEIGEIPAEWKLQTFEETFRVLSNNTLPRADLNDRRGTVRNVHYGDILTRFGEILDCEKDEIPYLNDVSLLTASAQVLLDGDVILADTAEDDTVGKATEVYGLGKGRMVAGLHTIPCRVKTGAFVPKWLGYYMNSPIYHDQVLPYVTGIKVSSISKTAISETLIAVPPPKEQKAIVLALSEVDQLLAELKKVVSKLRDFKRGCLYLMFPQEGSDIPQMREPGFTEPWQQRKLGEIAIEIIAGGDIDKNLILEDGRYPVIANAFSGDGIVGYYDTEYKVKAPAVTVTGRGDVGHAKARLADFTPTVRLLSVKSHHDVFFLENAINTLRIVIESTGVPQLTVPQLAKYELVFPQDFAEEEKVGAFFKEIDCFIALHQQKFDKYAQIKKAMMSELITGKIKLV